MPATITYDDGSGQTATNPRVFTISDTMIAVLEQFRKSVTQYDSTTQTMEPVYATIPDLLRGSINQSVMVAAINAFPPAEVVKAQQQVTSAQENLTTVITQTITGTLEG